MERRILTATILVLSVIATCFCASADNSLPIHRIAFGSCNRHDLPQPAWEGVLNTKPELWVWLGDVVYADNMYLPTFWKPSPVDVMRSKFDSQKEHAGYRQLRETCPIVGVWDDHDYGKNNGGSEYEDKIISQKIFLDFVDEPQDSPRRKQEGIYTSYTYGPVGKKIKLILLDTRYFRDDVDSGGDILGEDQWKWLDKELKQSDAQIHLIASGIQVLPTDKPLQEKWVSFPGSRKRLFDLLIKYNTPGAVLLSGDVHYAEIFKAEGLISYPFYEVTSSGMTHCCALQFPFCRTILDNFFRSKYQLTDFYEWFNFGTLEIHWEAEHPYMEIQIRNENGTIVRMATVVLGDLSPVKNFIAKPEEMPPFYLLWHAEQWRAIILGLLGSFVFYKVARKFLSKRSKKTGATTTHVPSANGKSKRQIKKIE